MHDNEVKFIHFISCDWEQALELVEELGEITSHEPVYIRLVEEPQKDSIYLAYSFVSPISAEEAQEAYDNYTFEEEDE
jgi:hypothetical protein